MDLTLLQTAGWVFIALSVLFFALTAGFDFGIGMVLPFIGQNDTERRVVLNVSGPTWDGNQVWLIIAGALIFAFWPTAFGTAFPGFYIALILFLWTIFLRPVAFEYRAKIQHDTWRHMWDIALFLGSFAPTLISGVAVGNLLLGVPFSLDPITLRSSWDGGFLDLLSPFGLLTGLLAVVMYLMHSGAYLQLRTRGVIQQRARHITRVCAWIYIILFALGGWAIRHFVMGYHLDPNTGNLQGSIGGWLYNYAAHPWMKIAPVIGFIGALVAIFGTRLAHASLALLGTSLAVAGAILTAALSTFPFILVSTKAPAQSLSIWNTSSPAYPLHWLFWICLIMMPIIVIYTTIIYHKLWKKGPLTVEALHAEPHKFY